MPRLATSVQQRTRAPPELKAFIARARAAAVMSPCSATAPDDDDDGAAGEAPRTSSPLSSPLPLSLPLLSSPKRSASCLLRCFASAVASA